MRRAAEHRVWIWLFAGRKDQPVQNLTDYARSVHWHQVRVTITSIIVFLDLAPRTFVDKKSGVGSERYLIVEGRPLLKI